MHFMVILDVLYHQENIKVGYNLGRNGHIVIVKM